MGGWLCIDEVYSHFFECPITDADCKLYGNHVGSCEGQQTWECFAILVPINMWAYQRNTDRIILKVRGDNIGALTLRIKMRPANPATTIVDRELTLGLIEHSFPPDAAYTPGIAHVVADWLFRIHVPNGDKYHELRPTL